MIDHIRLWFGRLLLRAAVSAHMNVIFALLILALGIAVDADPGNSLLIWIRDNVGINHTAWKWTFWFCAVILASPLARHKLIRPLLITPALALFYLALHFLLDERTGFRTSMVFIVMNAWLLVSTIMVYVGEESLREMYYKMVTLQTEVERLRKETSGAGD